MQPFKANHYSGHLSFPGLYQQQENITIKTSLHVYHKANIFADMISSSTEVYLKSADISRIS